MAVSKKSSVVNIELITNQLDQIYKSVEQLTKEIGNISTGMAVIQKTITDIEKIDLNYINQKVRDLIDANIFEAIQGGLAFKRLSWQFITAIVGALGITIYNLMFK